MLYYLHMSRPTSRYEKLYRDQGYAVIAGLDEAGKGAWAGPVVAGSVILPDNAELPKLNDSKLVTPKMREKLYDLIVAQAIAWGVGIQEAHMVDEIGLSAAHRLAMRQAVEALPAKPDFLLIDGIGIRQLGVESICIIRGDQKVRCIAAASIIAKVTRDRLMVKLHDQYPQYGFADHKGYGTEQHREAICKYGVCELHRISYEPVASGWQRSLFQQVSYQT
jgi:ribonuclease HII